MPRRTAFDDKLARITALSSVLPQEATPELRRFLGDANGYLVGEAAQVVRKLEIRTLTGDLTTAFSRLLAAPFTADKGCFGKKHILEALMQLDADVPDTYLAGLTFVQREPAYGEPIDTASQVRSLCAHALVQFDYRHQLVEVAPLLMDSQPDVRAEAAAALGNSGMEAAAAIVHLKVLMGDQEPEVLGACFRALLRLSPRRYLPLVCERLHDASAIAEVAALALGESRLPEAFTALKQACSSRSTHRIVESVLLGIALLRLDEANEFLCSLVENATESQAVAAIHALSMHRFDAKITERIRQAVANRSSRKLAAALKEKFPA